MSVVFAFLNVVGQFNTVYDTVVLLILIDLDIIAVFTILRWWKVWR